LENISGKKSCIRKRESGKRKNKEDLADASLKKRQLMARYQCIELLGEEFMKNGNYFLLISTFFCRGLQRIFVMAEVLVLLKVLVFLKTM